MHTYGFSFLISSDKKKKKKRKKAKDSDNEAEDVDSDAGRKSPVPDALPDEGMPEDEGVEEENPPADDPTDQEVGISHCEMGNWEDVKEGHENVFLSMRESPSHTDVQM